MRLLLRLLLTGLLAGTALAAEPQPVLVQPEGQQFKLLKNWTFGQQRPDATVHNKGELDQDFHYRYIWNEGKLDKFNTYWSYHRDYPEGDAKSLHVFSGDALTLKGRIPPGGGLRERGLESGMLRAKIPITPGMYMEMRAKLSGGVGAWPSYWLEQGVQSPDGTVSPPYKPLAEIDIFEFFNWDGRPQTRIFTGNIQTFGGREAYGNPHDIFTLLKDAKYERHLDLGFDCSKEFHVFALDWVENKPVWLIDGKPIKQTYYEWHGPAAHLTVVNSLGIVLPGVKTTEMVADEKQWDYTIDYIRLWQRTGGAIDVPVSSPANLAKAPAPAATGPTIIAANGKWQNPTIASAKEAAAQLKSHPVLKVDLTIAAEDADAGWFNAKLAINGEGFTRVEAPKWLLERPPGKAGLKKETISWDLSSVAAQLPASPNWFKIELVTQGDRPRKIEVTNLRAEMASGEAKTVQLKLDGAAAPAPAAAPATAAAAPEGHIPYPDQKNEAAWPGKGPIRAFDYMAGERKAFWAAREKDKGAIVFVGDSLTGGWKRLAQDFPKLKVANRGLGGDTSRGALFRFREDALTLDPKAIVIEIGNNDLTAGGNSADTLSNIADMVAQAEKAKPGMPIVLCTIPSSANPKAPVKPATRDAINEGLRKMVTEHKTTHLCDLYPVLANPDGTPNEAYFVADKLHMNEAGHTKWAELLLPIFEKLKL